MRTRARDQFGRVSKGAFVVLVGALLAGCGGGDGTTGGQTSTVAPEPTSSTQTTTGGASSELEVSQLPAVAPAQLNAEGLLAGTADTTDFPLGESGQMSTVETGPLSTNPSGSGSTLPLVIRNNTTESVSHVDIVATARDSSGSLVTTGNSQGTTPAQIPPGGLAFSYIYFDISASAPPPDAEYEFSFETSPADQSPFNTATVQTQEAVLSGESIVGTGINETNATLTGPYSVDVACFDGGGAITEVVRSFANEDGDLAPGDSVSFNVSLFDQPCTTFFAGITGYFA